MIARTTHTTQPQSIAEALSLVTAAHVARLSAPFCTAVQETAFRFGATREQLDQAVARGTTS